MVKPLQDVTIQLREFLTKRHRAREALITTLLWALYGYLWLPLISFAAWYFGYEFYYEMIVRAGGPDELIVLLLWFGNACLIVLLLVVSWSGFQYSRFKGDGERRTRFSTLDPQAECDYWGIESEVAQRLKSAKVVTVSLDEAGQLTKIN